MHRRVRDDAYTRLLAIANHLAFFLAIAEVVEVLHGGELRPVVEFGEVLEGGELGRPHR